MVLDAAPLSAVLVLLILTALDAGRVKVARCALSEVSEDASLLQVPRSWNSSTSGMPCLREAACSTGPFGRLGNHLYILGALLDYAARENLCYVLTGAMMDATLGQVIKLPQAIDVATGKGLPLHAVGNITCTRKCRFVGDCGRWRRGHKYIVREEMQRFVKSNGQMLRCNKSISHSALGPNGVVMHLRSGDVMQAGARSGYYPQPPCSFYNELAEHGNNGSAYQSVLIVTEPDRRNPCAELLQSQLRSKIAEVEIQTTSVTHDACMLVLGQNLAISMGTWGPALASLNTNLRHLHVPFGLDNGTKYPARFDSLDDTWYRETVVENGLASVAQHVYSFPGYNTTWDNWEDRVAKMVNYPSREIVVRTISALDPKSS